MENVEVKILRGIFLYQKFLHYLYRFLELLYKYR